MEEGAIRVAYIGASILFILSLGGLSRQETARRGNLYGMIGMTIAVVATILAQGVTGYMPILIAMVLGGGIGVVVASRVAMTAMPELVAILHSFVGLAAVLVGFASYLSPTHSYVGAERIVHDTEIYIGVLIGAVTFTGSVMAFGKLKGSITSKPVMLPGRHWLNLVLVVACIAFGILFARADSVSAGMMPLLIMTAIALVLGVHMVMAIGGADMPVVVSMLNSYSGWAAAATGFMLSNDLLIVTGALVGSSGAILSYIMCRAMNRSFVSVIAGGFGAGAGTSPARVREETGEITEIQAEETARLLREAANVVIVPGYGMAVAQAQYPVHEVMKCLRDAGVNVRFAIHPVAGRLPGHMNVLLAEAAVPYDVVLEMDEVNPDMPQTDVVLVIGANDIVNPDAEDDPGSPIAGMPVIQVWKAGTVIIMKRSMAAGYAGVGNPLFLKPNSRMLFGDAKKSVEAILEHLQANA